MTKPEAVRLLSQAGFKLVKQNQRSEIWTKAGYDVTLDKSYHMDPNVPHRVRKAIRMTARSTKAAVPLTTKMAEFLKPENKNEAIWLKCDKCGFGTDKPHEAAIHEATKHPKEKVPTDEIGMFNQLLPKPPKPEPEKIEINPPIKYDAPPTKQDSPLIKGALLSSFKGRVRMPAEHRRKVRKLIKSLASSGLSYKGIRDELNRQKIASASGQPWTYEMVDRQLVMIRKRRRRALADTKKIQDKVEKIDAEILVNEPVLEAIAHRPPQPEPPPVKKAIDLPPSIELILEDNALTDSQKLAVMKAVGAKLPPSIALMLDDNHLTDEQRMAVLRTLLK